jgi:outer membrane protein OmpA-like peptidoglycan-associated protein
MTGLMMIFMLIAILFMVRVESESDTVKELKHEADLRAEQMAKLAQKTELQNERMKSVVLLYDDMRERLYTDLLNEFRSDLPRWGATLDRDLAIRFEEPEVLFDTGRFALKPQFISILSDFFPRYVRILSSPRYRDSIEEIRIEGHTSSVWTSGTSPDQAYFKNMELSQARTRATLDDVILLPQVSKEKSWLITRLTANGLSSSHLIRNPDGSENRLASQRVEFRVRTNAEAKIGQILEAGKK